MKISNDFMMRDIAGEKIVVPTGAAAELNALITLNEVAAFMWECLQTDRTPEEVGQMVLKEYDVDEETVKRDVDNFISALRYFGMLEEQK